MNQNVNVVDHDHPGSQLVQLQLTFTIVENIDDALSHALVGKPSWTCLRFVQSLIYGGECSSRRLSVMANGSG